MPGFVELVFILVILVAVFGFRRLPDLGEALGRAVHDSRNPRAAGPPPSRSAIEVEPVAIELEPGAPPDDAER